jgi:hypothetical protein
VGVASMPSWGIYVILYVLVLLRTLHIVYYRSMDYVLPKHVAENCKFIKYLIKCSVRIYFIALIN